MRLDAVSTAVLVTAAVGIVGAGIYALASLQPKRALGPVVEAQAPSVPEPSPPQSSARDDAQQAYDGADEPQPEVDLSWISNKEDAVKASEKFSCYHNFVPMDIVQKLDGNTFLGYTGFSVGSPMAMLMIYDTDNRPTRSGRTVLSPRSGLALSGTQNIQMESGFERKVSVLKIGDKTCAHLWSIIEKEIMPEPTIDTSARIVDANGNEIVILKPRPVKRNAASQDSTPVSPSSPASEPAAEAAASASP